MADATVGPVCPVLPLPLARPAFTRGSGQHEFVHPSEGMKTCLSILAARMADGHTTRGPDVRVPLAALV